MTSSNMCKEMPQGFRFQGSALGQVPQGRKGSCVGFDNKLSRLCVLWLIYKMSKLLERRILIYLRVVAKSREAWGCESEGIKGVYKNS